MKQKIRINESTLRKIVAESVRRVLKESIDIKQEVENVVNAMGSQIERWYGDDEFIDKHGCNGYIFNDEDEARESVLNGYEHQNAVDYVDGAQTDEEWVNYLVHGGVDRNQAMQIINNGDWDSVVSIIVDVYGPEWFLSTYSGSIHRLSNGQLLYF